MQQKLQDNMRETTGRERRAGRNRARGTYVSQNITVGSVYYSHGGFTLMFSNYSRWCAHLRNHTVLQTEEAVFVLHVILQSEEWQGYLQSWQAEVERS